MAPGSLLPGAFSLKRTGMDEEEKLRLIVSCVRKALNMLQNRRIVLSIFYKTGLFGWREDPKSGRDFSEW